MEALVSRCDSDLKTEEQTRQPTSTISQNEKLLKKSKERNGIYLEDITFFILSLRTFYSDLYMQF